MENIQGGRAKEKEDASDLFLLKKPVKRYLSIFGGAGDRFPRFLAK